MRIGITLQALGYLYKTYDDSLLQIMIGLG